MSGSVGVGSASPSSRRRLASITSSTRLRCFSSIDACCSEACSNPSSSSVTESWIASTSRSSLRFCLRVLIIAALDLRLFFTFPRRSTSLSISVLRSPVMLTLDKATASLHLPNNTLLRVSPSSRAVIPPPPMVEPTPVDSPN